MAISSLSSVQRRGNQIFSPVRQKWLVETPEELVRQEYLTALTGEYGYSLAQIAEEIDVTGRGSGRARADFLIWQSEGAKRDLLNPLIVVECKASTSTIKPEDYWQGDNYARLSGAKFFVTHNARETRYWRVVHERMPKSLEEIENIPHAHASDAEIHSILTRLRVFKEDEFADLLHRCHNLIRNREKKDPAAAFDEIAKILFVKVWVERELQTRRRRDNIFSVAFLDSQLGDNPLDDLFHKTKAFYRVDQIFETDDRINLKPSTGREIVGLLERYNLSDTSEDIKGIAFERFLGRTFRGEIGQFFTPRAIVEFMVRMTRPVEGEIVCDPASGSGGFLIRFFEIVRDQITNEVDREYERFKKQIESSSRSRAEQAKLLRNKFAELSRSVEVAVEGSRSWQLANRGIFGTDANDRMARTSKMNMIMHGDGHGGVHHHDGFINVNGIFENRFDVVLTNPPFGATISQRDIVQKQDVSATPAQEEQYVREYGSDYVHAHARTAAAVGKPLLSLYELPKNASSSIRTEVLFLERCLALLRDGGRLGIVLPEGIFNNPSLGYVREFCEDRAFIRAVVSLPQETFYSAGASVKASILFLQKFTRSEARRYAKVKAVAEDEAEAWGNEEFGRQIQALASEVANAREAGTHEVHSALRKKLRALERRRDDAVHIEARRRLREAFDYPVFLYRAESVGITGTGEETDNELFPNDSVPKGVEETCLERFETFLRENKIRW